MAAMELGLARVPRTPPQRTLLERHGCAGLLLVGPAPEDLGTEGEGILS